MREGLFHVIAGVFFVVVVGGYAHLRGRRESARGDLSRLTRLLMLLSFGGLGATILSASFFHAWPIGPTGDAWSSRLLTIGGIALIVIGATIVIAVFTGSRKRTWAVDTDTLATTGIYGRTRNPRAVGWFLIYVGLALACGSGAALSLAPVFLLGYLPWILLEEDALERHFGDEYRAYRQRTPRFI